MSELLNRLVITVDMTAGTVSPSTPQSGGVRGDNRALCLVFQPLDMTYRYRLEIVDGSGAYDITLPMMAQDGVLSYEIPAAWTAAGTAAIRLIAVGEGDDAVVRHFQPLYVYFADREEGNAMGEMLPCWQTVMVQVTAAAQRAALSAESANAATESADGAAERASQAAQSADNAAQAAVLAAEQADVSRGECDTATDHANTAISQMTELLTDCETVKNDMEIKMGDGTFIPTIAAGESQTGAPDSEVEFSLTRVGEKDYLLNLQIPRGEQGEIGPQGIQGVKGDKGDKGDEMVIKDVDVGVDYVVQFRLINGKPAIVYQIQGG